MEPLSETTRYRCEKHQIDVAEACPKCKDPELYCKYRSNCLIHFLEKQDRKHVKIKR